MYLRESMLRQKSRNQWIKEGYLNSRFFHSYMKHKFRNNSIVGLITSTSLKEKMDDIRWKCNVILKKFLENLLRGDLLLKVLIFRS